MVIPTKAYLEYYYYYYFYYYYCERFESRSHFQYDMLINLNVTSRLNRSLLGRKLKFKT